jgi:hypothetical protein
MRISTVGMSDVGLSEIPGSIPAGGVYFSTPIWHHFSMPESIVSFWLICLMSLSILHKFKKVIKITLRSKKIKKDPCKVSDEGHVPQCLLNLHYLRQVPYMAPTSWE